jgi:hypothetical protein
VSQDLPDTRTELWGAVRQTKGVTRGFVNVVANGAGWNISWIHEFARLDTATIPGIKLSPYTWQIA